MTRKKIILIIIAIILLFGGSFFAYRKFFQKKEAVPVEKNYFEINDEASGIYFRVGKKFERMPARDLQSKNPNFIYGFSAKDDASVNCFVSQTKREKEGQMTVGNLRDGVFLQLQKIDANAKIDSAEVIEIGENSNKGAKLEMSYTEGKKIPMLQWEVVGITAKTATFAFCTSPKAVLDLYKEDFNLFLDSVRIK
ncbi:MAG: hypothetical protein Q7U36_01485 [bacterium]|nr:hypothetical protein [bacterium]